MVMAAQNIDLFAAARSMDYLDLLSTEIETLNWHCRYGYLQFQSLW